MFTQFLDIPLACFCLGIVSLIVRRRPCSFIVAFPSHLFLAQQSLSPERVTATSSQAFRYNYRPQLANVYLAYTR